MPVETRDPYAGPVRSIDLERDINTGRIYHLHRIHMEPGAIVTDDEAEQQWRQFPDTVATDFGAPEGGTFREPSAALVSMRRHSVIRYRVALALLAAVAAYLSHIAWPLVAA